MLFNFLLDYKIEPLRDSAEVETILEGVPISSTAHVFIFDRSLVANEESVFLEAVVNDIRSPLVRHNLVFAKKALIALFGLDLHLEDLAFDSATRASKRACSSSFLSVIANNLR